MSRIFSVFMVVAASCTFAFSASTNFVGDGSQTIGFTNLQFSGNGTPPTNYAAHVEDVAELISIGTDYRGGAGGSTNNSSSGNFTLSASGGDGIRFNIEIDEDDGAGQTLNFQSGEAYGGDGGSVSGKEGNSLYSDGGAGLYVEAGVVEIGQGRFIGGMGGHSTGTTGSVSSVIASSRGGDGIKIDYDNTLFETLDGNVYAEGGSGGTARDADTADASGGMGLNLIWNVKKLFPTKELIISGGEFRGGAGGSAEGVLDAQANGGAGFNMSAAKLIINGGSFIGGNGGSATVFDTTNGVASANGGTGLSLFFNEIGIFGGTFTGGAAGTANGVTGANGFGLDLSDCNTVISGETVNASSLRVVSAYRPITTEIYAGSFGEAWFITGNHPISGNPGNNTVTNTGGGFSNLHIGGVGGNNINILGSSSFEDLHLSGTGANDISIAPSVFSSGRVTQSGGTANINLWGDRHFANTTVSGGTMNFNTHEFALGDGSSFALEGQNSAVNFNGGLVAQGGTFVVDYDGTTNGVIRGTALTFEEGTKWTINGGDNAVDLDGKLTLAESSTSNLTSFMSFADVSYEGTAASWVEGIVALTNDSAHQLIGTYGTQRFEDALKLDSDSEFGKAMSDLSDYTGIEDTGKDEYVSLKALSDDEAYNTLAEGYVRTPEMANALINLQSVFADQIKDRTRSYLRHENWGNVASHAPQGAQGPEAWNNSMDWLNERLPKWESSKTMTSHSDTPGYPSKPPAKAKAHSPKTSRDKIEIPPTYQVWGRGYGAFFDQDATTGFAGYEASVGGGVIGLDKRFNNLLVGLGGGYAQTVVDGNSGSDGDANTGYGTAYAAITGEKTFVDFNVNYALNDVETEGDPLLGYTGDYDANTVSFYVGGGLGLDWGSVLFTPEASLLTTHYDRESYTETSSATDDYPDKEWDAYSQWSYLGSLGATLSMVQKIENFNIEMEFQPEVRAHWLHEFNADMDDPTYKMTDPGGVIVGGPNTIAVALQAREEDLIKVGAGVRFSKWDSDTLEFGLDFDGAFGQDYAAYIISGKLMHRF